MIINIRRESKEDFLTLEHGGKKVEFSRDSLGGLILTELITVSDPNPSRPWYPLALVYVKDPQRKTLLYRLLDCAMAYGGTSVPSTDIPTTASLLAFIRKLRERIWHSPTCASLRPSCSNCAKAGHTHYINQHFDHGNQPCAHCSCTNFNASKCNCGFVEIQEELRTILK